MADHFKGLFVAALDRNSSWWYAFLACSRWVGFRLDTLAAITLSFECVLVMAVHERVSLPTALPYLPLAPCLPMCLTCSCSSLACLLHLSAIHILSISFGPPPQHPYLHPHPILVNSFPSIAAFSSTSAVLVHLLLLNCSSA